MQGGVNKEEDMEEQDHGGSRAGVKIKSGVEEEESDEQKVTDAEAVAHFCLVKVVNFGVLLSLFTS